MTPFSKSPLQSLTLDLCQQVDIYLVDQILKGNILPHHRVLDAGCGHGRNLGVLEQMGCDVYGFDADVHAIQSLRSHMPDDIQGHFKTGLLGESPFSGETFDVVIANAVFHFAPDREAFQIWANECWAQCAPGGLFFARLSTQIAWPEGASPCFPFLASEGDLIEAEQRWNAQRVDPLKTTRVEDRRTMTTWVLRAPC
jgi:2-polyprenyl-3-methyl-5-hydroxy-6-metoxy-1,4-benzoquinol methylase